MKNSEPNGKVHYSYLVTAAISFELGIVTILIIKNYIGEEKINFSTLDILNLVFSIGLSTASIVLALVAIVLSRKSEQAIISRNDEGIRYQSEIFNRTTEVLSKIETSTGISEKRIEDIARQIRSVERSKPGPESKDDQVRDVLREAFRPRSERSILRNSRFIPDRQHEFTKSVMEKIKKIKDVKSVRAGSGDFYKSGEEMVDVIFSANGKRFSVSTFHSYGPQKIINFADVDTFKQYFINLASELSENVFEKAFLVFNKDISKDEGFITLFDNTLATLNEKIAKRIILVSGSLEEVEKKIDLEIHTII